jgi:hypothetical protein
MSMAFWEGRSVRRVRTLQRECTCAVEKEKGQRDKTEPCRPRLDACPIASRRCCVSYRRDGHVPRDLARVGEDSVCELRISRVVEDQGRRSRRELPLVIHPQLQQRASLCIRHRRLEDARAVGQRGKVCHGEAGVQDAGAAAGGRGGGDVRGRSAELRSGG